MAVHPPGPRDYFLGATIARRFRQSMLEFVTEMGREYGDIASVRLGPLRAYFVNSPPLVREVLVSKHKHFCRPKWMTKPLSKIDGNGLVLSDGPFWLRQRRLVAPAFSTRRFDGYAEVTVKYTQQMLGRWSGGAIYDVADEMTHLTLDIIANTLFGVDLGDRAPSLGEAVRTFSEAYVQDAGNPFALPSWIPTAKNRRNREAISTIDRLVRGIIRQRRASGEDRGDLLSMLLLAVDEEGDGSGMTDEQARDEAVTLFNAGHDSTAAGLAWIWYLVAKHPDVQNRLIDEVDRALSGRTAAFSDLPKLPYVEMVVKESLRLYPPTWILLPREVVEPIELAGYKIGRGSWIYASPWVTQRDPRFFPDPLRFDPERFSPARAESIPPFAYFPFGGGPRICIGSNFATMEMILIVASVLQKFRVHLAGGQGDAEPEALISIRPKGGMQIALEKRPEPAYASGD